MSDINLSKRALSIEPSLTLQISAKANQLASEGVDTVSYTHLTLPTNTPV